MNINIIGKQVTIRDDMKALAEKKLAKFDRYFPEGADAVVTVRREEKDQLRVETTISVGGTLFPRGGELIGIQKRPYEMRGAYRGNRFARTRQDLRKE